MMNCQECENLLDEYFHLQLSSKIKNQIKVHLKNCLKCQRSFQEYKNMLQELRCLKVQPCPEEVTEKVFRILNLGNEKEIHISLIEKFIERVSRYRWKIALAGATAAIVFFMILIYPGIYQQNEIKQQYTEAEIDQAKDQVKLALAYFNEITSRTQKILEDQVLPEQIIKPMKSSIKTAIKPLLNGGES